MLRYILIIVAGGFSLLHSVEIISVFQNAIPDAAIPLETQLGFAIFWMVSFGWKALQLLRRTGSAQIRTLLMICGFAIYVVLRLLIYAQADYDRQRLPFLVFGLSILLVFIGIVRLSQARIRKMEHPSYDS